MFNNKFQKIKERIIIVLENSSMSTEVEISPESFLREELGLDSLALAELAVRVEDEYGVDVFEDGLVNSVSEILNKI